MLKTVNGTGRYMIVSGGIPSPTYINTSSGNLNVGSMRFNPSHQRIEVYDGNSWVEMNTGHTLIGLTPEAESLLDWAKEKRTQEIQIEALSKSNPTIADLFEQKKNLDHKIKMIQILIKEEPKIGTT
jgi:hypothetical protein